MIKLMGVALAFSLGYMTASHELFKYLWQERVVLYIILGIVGIFLLVFIPLERLAESESVQNPLYTLRSSAREHLQRRGSF